MKTQITIYLEPPLVEAVRRLQTVGAYDSQNAAFEHVIERGLETLRDEYATHQRTLPSKPASKRDPYGKSAWTKELSELYGD